MATKDGARKTIVIDRTYDASIEDVWELWTTAEGIESWWGPEGFSVKVRSLDLRPGGTLHYAMTATAPPQVEFMKQAGMPLTTEAKITYVEVVAPRRLVYTNLADFVPGVAPYDVGTTVELLPAPNGVKVVLTLEEMHDATWTGRMVSGWESELGKLERAIAARR